MKLNEFQNKCTNKISNITNLSNTTHIFPFCTCLLVIRNHIWSMMFLGIPAHLFTNKNQWVFPMSFSDGSSTSPKWQLTSLHLRINLSLKFRWEDWPIWPVCFLFLFELWHMFNTNLKLIPSLNYLHVPSLDFQLAAILLSHVPHMWDLFTEET